MSVIIPDHDHLDLVLTPLRRERPGPDGGRLTFVGREILADLHRLYNGGTATADDMALVRRYIFQEATEDVSPVRILAAVHWLGYQLAGAARDSDASRHFDEISGAATRLVIAGEELGEWHRERDSVRTAIDSLATARTVQARREQFDF